MYVNFAHDVWNHLQKCGPKRRAELVKCFGCSDDDMRYALNILTEYDMAKVSPKGVWSAVWKTTDTKRRKR